MITEAFVRNGKVYFVTDDGKIYAVYKDGDDYTVEYIQDLS